jgi:outer membrane biosynthesis protein TonB
MVSSFIAIMVFIIIGVAVVVPVIQSIMSDPKITSGLPESAKTIMSLLPIFILVAVALSVLGLFGGFGRSDDYTPTRGREPDEEDEETEDEPEEPSVTVHEKKPKKEPEPEPVNTLEPEVPRKYKKHGKSYRTIRADMMLDEKKKKKNGN